MKVAIITDQHFGARKNSKLFHDYFLKFYNEVFFPTLEKEGITTVVDMGDTFDSRKGIDFSALSWAKNNYYDRLKKLGITVHTVVGNHTAYYKNTNEVNAVDLLLREYENVFVYSEPTEVKLGNLKTLFIPWINQENEESTFKSIKSTTCSCAMGHLELRGFRVNKQIVMEHGLESTLFEKFSKVFSGHYHTRSSSENVFYLGNPYEIYWTDVGDTRGFHLFDTETAKLQFIKNPINMFEKIFYNDETTNYAMISGEHYKDKFIKLIVEKKKNYYDFDMFIERLYQVGIHELKIVDNTHEDIETSGDIEVEGTMSFLEKYIDEIDYEEKDNLKNLINSIYVESLQVE